VHQVLREKKVIRDYAGNQDNGFRANNKIVQPITRRPSNEGLFYFIAK